MQLATAGYIHLYPAPLSGIVYAACIERDPIPTILLYISIHTHIYKYEYYTPNNGGSIIFRSISLY